MIQVNIHEAKSRLSQLIAEAEGGEEVVISRSGKPAVRLVPVKSPGGIRFGALEGKVKIPEEFYEPLPDDILAAFEGRDEEEEPSK